MASNKYFKILKFDIMPVIKPVNIEEEINKNCFSIRRQWIIEQDWKYNLYEKEFIIKKGFKFDGASVPSGLKLWRSPTGILFIASLIHDWGYQKASLAKLNKMNEIMNIPKTRKEIDIIFMDINYDNKYFKYITYYILKIFGWRSWNRYRKIERDYKIEINRL